MLRRLLFALLFAALVGEISVPVLAQDATPVSSGVIPRDETVAGLSLEEWHARWWQWWYSLPPAVDPYFDETGERCGYGQHGPVFFLMLAEQNVERGCTVPAGVALFVPVLLTECSTFEPDPENPNPASADEATLRACAKTHIDVGLERDLAVVAVEINGERVTDLGQYRAPTALFQLPIPDPTIGVQHSVADGIVVLIGPLAEGEHIVTFTIQGGIRITYQLTVSAGPITVASS